MVIVVYQQILVLILVAFYAVTPLLAQEVCDNGMDDNGNGLIDLYDPECTCDGIHIPLGPSNQIPNPDFESMLFCPSAFADMGALESWGFGNQTTPDYLNTCGFVIPAVPAMNLTPFPNGNGVLGLVFLDNHKETASVCLTEPFLAGYEYTLTFRVASVPTGFAGALCNNGVITYPAVDITLYGHPDCSTLWVNTPGCPSEMDPNWVVLGAANYTPLTDWGEATMTFTPSQNIGAIMIGPPCDLPTGYNGSPCTPYFLIDDFLIEEVAVYTDLNLLLIGGLCQTEVTLTADIGHSGGIWQWYFNGAAIQGLNESSMEVSENGNQSGMYAVTYSFNGECATDSVWVDVYIPDTTYQEVFLCPGNTVFCAGEPFIEAGVYNVFIDNGPDCDSLVQCTITEYNLPPPTILNLETCWPAHVEVCNQVITSEGPHTIYCNKAPECDSIVYLELTVLHPLAVIQDSGMLSCDTLDRVTLNGLDSFPDVAETYHWSGPPNGIVGANNNPVIEAVLPGTYCLNLTYTGNSTTCFDTACITLVAQSKIPDPPLLLVPPFACLEKPVQIPILPYTGNSPTGYFLDINPSAAYHIIGDSLIEFTFPQSGTYALCVQAVNECGLSDTTCYQIEVIQPDSVYTEYFTCDVSQVGLDTIFFHNQFGCDSIVFSQTSLLPSHFVHEIIFTCDSLQAGKDTVFLFNQAGCDSIIYVDIQYTEVYTSVQEEIICGTGTNFADTLVIQTGACDSIFITNFNYEIPDTTYLFSSTCDPSQSGEFIQTLTNISGCDSIIITTILLNPKDTTLLQDFTCNANDSTIVQSNYTNQFGCDSLVILMIQFVGIDTQFVQMQTCDSTQVGTVVHIIHGFYCDTVRVISTLWSASITGMEMVYSCDSVGPASDTSYYSLQNGCDSMHIRHFIYSQLQATPQVVDELCAGQNNGRLTLNNIIGGSPPFQFSLNNGAWKTTAEFTGLPPGNYTLTVQDAAGCQRTFTGIIVHEGMVLHVYAGPDHEVIPGTTIDLTAQITAAWSDIQWLATDPIQCASCQQTSLGPIFNEQPVYLTVINDLGCTGMDTLAVSLLPEIIPDVYIPNTFSPNNDGINDYFWIYGNDQILSVRNLAIYDRWGNAIYSKKSISLNNPSEGWDGSFRGKTLDPGVYIYVVEVEFADGSVRLFKGEVTLVR